MKVTKPLTRSESAPGRKPSLTVNQWPSSSTVCQSDSLVLSEISIDVDGSEQGISLSKQPKNSSVDYGKQKHHSFSGTGFCNQKPGTSPFSAMVDSKFSPVGRKRALLRKIRSLPKLIPVKRNSSMGSADLRLKRGIRWKTLAESSVEKIITPRTLEFEKMYRRESKADTLSVPGKFISLETPEIKCANTLFPNLKNFRNPKEAIYCDMCRRRIQRISVSPNPEAVSFVNGMRRCYSVPVLIDDHSENLGRDRAYSWQNKVFDRVKNEAKDIEQLNKFCERDSTFISHSAPSLLFWNNNLLYIKSPDINDNGLNFGMANEKTDINSFQLSNSTPVKTLLIPNPELEMDTSSPPSSRKNSEMDTISLPLSRRNSELDSSSPPPSPSRKDSEVLKENSQDAGSWKSADWTTLLGTPDLPNS